MAIKLSLFYLHFLTFFLFCDFTKGAGLERGVAMNIF